MLQLLVLAHALVPLAFSIHQEQELPWKGSKELQLVRDESAPTAERVRMAKALIARAVARDEAAELAAELLTLVSRNGTDWEVMDSVTRQLRELTAPKLRDYVAHEITLARSDRRWEILIRTAAGWKDARIDQAVLRKLVKDPEDGVAGWCLWLLDWDDYGPGVPAIVSILERKDLDLEGARLASLVDTGTSLTLGTGYHTVWRDAQKRFAQDRRDVVRRAALEFLVRTVEAADLPILRAAGKHEDWSSRRWALEGFAQLRAPESVDAILEIMARERRGSRLRAGSARVLARLCGQSFGLDVEAWKSWWLASGRALAPRPEADAPAVPDGISAPVFLGTTVCSDRVLIVLDVDPLARRALTDAAATRRAEALQDALADYVSSLPVEARWNVLVSRREPVEWKPKLSAPLPKSTRKTREASASSKAADMTEREREVEALRDFLYVQLGPGLPTDGIDQKQLWPTLARAWKESEADTVLFVSDGELLTGEGHAEDQLSDYANSLDDHRGLRVHTFSLGEDVPSLRALAKHCTGEYRRVETPR